jgi:hypothetical protein
LQPCTSTARTCITHNSIFIGASQSRLASFLATIAAIQDRDRASARFLISQIHLRTTARYPGSCSSASQSGRCFHQPDTRYTAARRLSRPRLTSLAARRHGIPEACIACRIVAPATGIHAKCLRGGAHLPGARYCSKQWLKCPDTQREQQ